MIKPARVWAQSIFLGRGCRTTELTFWITTATLEAWPICSVPTSKKHGNVLSSSVMPTTSSYGNSTGLLRCV